MFDILNYKNNELLGFAINAPMLSAGQHFHTNRLHGRGLAEVSDATVVEHVVFRLERFNYVFKGLSHTKWYITTDGNPPDWLWETDNFLKFGVQ